MGKYRVKLMLSTRWELMEMARRLFLVGVFVDIEPDTITQLMVGTIFCAIFLMIQLLARPYRNHGDDYLACASSFSLLILFICATIYKYDALISSTDIEGKMSIEQKDTYLLNSVLLSLFFVLSVIGALVSAAVILCVQVAFEFHKAKLSRRLRYVDTHELVPTPTLNDHRHYHLFLSHAWVAAQDQVRSSLTRVHIVVFM
jgi:hypothetical protein